MTSTSSQRLRAGGARDVRVGELVDQGDRRAPRQDQRSVSISSTTTPRYSIRRRGTISRPSSSSSVCGRPCASTKPTTRSVPRADASMALLEHPVGLADAGRHAEVDAQPPAAAGHVSSGRARASRRPSGGRRTRRAPGRSLQQPVQVEVELEDVDPRLAEEPEQRLLGVARRRPRGRRRPVMPRAAATRATWYSADGRADVRIEPRRRRRDQVHGDRHAAVRGLRTSTTAR